MERWRGREGRRETRERGEERGDPYGEEREISQSDRVGDKWDYLDISYNKRAHAHTDRRARTHIHTQSQTQK